MLDLQQRAGTREQPGALLLGEKILLYREWIGTDDHWHGVVVLSDGTRVVIEQRE